MGLVADPHPDYPYAPDQFDREAETTSFHGAHRAEESFWRQNLLYVIIIAAAVLTLLVLLFVIGGMGRDNGGDAPAATSTASAPVEQQSPGASDGGGTSTPAQEVSRDTPVLVVNAGGQNGMAGEWRDELTSKGWTKVDISTADSRQEQAVVFYRDEADAASANQLAQEVGLDGAQQSDEYDARITFVAVESPQD